MGKKWVAFAALFLPLSAGAGFDPPQPLFAPPLYIDPGYKPETEFQETPYSGIAWFTSLVGPMPASKEPLQEAIPFSDAFEARYRNTIAELLRSKGIDPSSVQLPDQLISVFGNERCTRHNHEPTLEFLRAAFADARVKSGHVELIRVRHKIGGLCSWTPERNLYADSLAAVMDLRRAHPTLRLYADYLEGIAHFYAGAFEQAIALFEKLAEPSRRHWWSIWHQTQSDAPWVKETALYMSARAQLHFAQRNWDGLGNKDRIDTESLRKAREGYKVYLETYPKGLYAASVQNFERRLLFLSKEHNKLNSLLDKRLSNALRSWPTHPVDRSAMEEALTEHVLYFRGDPDARTATPLVLAFHILRGKFPDSGSFKAREKDFADYPGLFSFLRAFMLYQQKRFAEVIALTPEAPLRQDPVILGTEALRARSFAALGQYDAAIKAWRRIRTSTRDESSQLELANLYATSQRPEQIFLDAAHIDHAWILWGMALFRVDIPTLEKISDLAALSPERRAVIHQALLQRYLMASEFVKLDRLFAKVPNAQAMEPMRAPAAVLARDPMNVRARLDVGKFMYHRYFHPERSRIEYPDDYPTITLIDALNSVCRDCIDLKALVKSGRAPIAHFQIAQKQAAQRNDPQEAEALHYLVRCWRGGEQRDRCFWDYEAEERKNDSRQNFRRLHRLFPKSEWAKKTPFYYE